MKNRRILVLLMTLATLCLERANSQDLNAISGSGFNIATSFTPTNAPENTVIMGLQNQYDANYKWQFVHAYNSDNYYFRRYQYGWNNYLKIWHAGNLNSSDIDFTAKNVNTSSTINSYSAYNVPAFQFNGGSYFRSNGTYVVLQQNGTSDDKTFYINGFSNILKDLNIVYHAGNLNRNDVDFRAKNLIIGADNQIATISGPANSGAIQIKTCSWASGYDSRYIRLGNYNNNGDFTSHLAVLDNGNVGIGTTNPQNKLDVNGTIHAKEVKVDLNGWSDFVFSPSYKLKTLAEVENYIKTHGHLAEIPSATEVEKNGISLGDMQTKLLQKLEESTLYLIEQSKQIEALKKENEQKEMKYNQLASELQQLKIMIKNNKEIPKTPNL